MLNKLREKLNGNLQEIIKVVVVGGLIFWMFCQVRDLPATYVTKSELKAEVTSVQKAIQSMDEKVNDIHFYLMGKRGK